MMRIRGGFVVVLAVAVATGGCALAGRTFGSYVDDKATTAAVKIRITGVVPKALSRVNVDTYHATVYLSGVVDTPIEKSDVEIAAWKVESVRQVVNDLQVRSAARDIPTPDDAPVYIGVLGRMRGIARVDPGLPGQPDVAYDGAGRAVATVYTVLMRDLTASGLDAQATGRPIDHVSIYPVEPQPDVPEFEYYVVLWHVTRAEAAALR